MQIVPLHRPMLRDFDGQQDGTNAFIYSRFLVPELFDFRGWAIYCDSDMLARESLTALWTQRDETKAALVVKHDYETKNSRKAIGSFLESRNEHYPRKNWSSLILWNCGHPQNRILTRDFVAEAGGKRLHRFEWLSDDLIGGLPIEWNHLVGEIPTTPSAKLVHYTLGVPGMPYYQHCEYSEEWKRTLSEVSRLD